MRPTEGYYVAEGVPHNGAICWFCDASIRAGGVMVRYLYAPQSPPRPVCQTCAAEFAPETPETPETIGQSCPL